VEPSARAGLARTESGEIPNIMWGLSAINPSSMVSAIFFCLSSALASPLEIHNEFVFGKKRQLGMSFAQEHSDIVKLTT